MRQQLKITNTHGLTLDDLHKQRNTNTAKKAFVKITTIMLCLKEKSAAEIAEILDLDIHTVSKYIRTFNEGGLEQLLAYKKTPGRPSKLSEPEQELCKEMFCLSPAELDLEIDVNWNSRIMQTFIKDEFGKELNRSTIQRMVAKLGFSYTRPTYVLANADPEKQQEFEKQFEDLKKN
jgi:transposase